MIRKSVLVVGVGRVGSAVANALLGVRGVGRVFLDDVNRFLVEAEYLDLASASVALRGENVVELYEPGAHSGEVDVVVFCAGKARVKAQQHKTTLGIFNKVVVREWCKANEVLGKRGVLVLVVSNPPDVLRGVFEFYGFNAVTLGLRLEYARLGAWFPGLVGEVVFMGSHQEFYAVREVGGVTKADRRFGAKIKHLNNVVLEGKGFTNWGVAACVAQWFKSKEKRAT